MPPATLRGVGVFTKLYFVIFRIFSPNFTRLLYVPISTLDYKFLLSPTITKLCHIKYMIKMSAIGGNARWVVALNVA